MNSTTAVAADGGVSIVVSGWVIAHRLGFALLKRLFGTIIESVSVSN